MTQDVRDLALVVMVPNGWTRETLSNVCKVIDCKHRTPAYVESGIPLVSPGTIKWGELDLISPIKRVSDEEYQSLMDHCSVDIGDLVMSRNQSIGIASYVESNAPFVLGQDTVLIKPFKADSKFVYYKLQSDDIQQSIVKLAGGSTFTRINLADIRKLKINLPSFLEQKKIAKILSTWDKAIITTEQLLINSQQQKKALMQQLLTGKTRLLDKNGVRFSGEWVAYHLNKIANVIVSPVDKKAEPDEIPVELCNYTDVYYNHLITNKISFMKATATKSEIEKYTLVKGDVIITKDSETPGDIAVPALVSEDLGGVVCGYHLAIVRPFSNYVDSSFLNYLFSMQKTRYYFFTLATGATRFGLSVGGINNAHFRIPDIEEQQKIASMLSTGDQEIETLQRKLDCLKQEKKALMQQLLTGKRRVKI